MAGTDAIGTTEVRILLSVDGGATFPHVLASRTPNDGTESVTLPDLATSKARLKVEAVGNVFFDLNDADLTIQASPRVSTSGSPVVQYSDSPTVTVGASDPDSAGAALSAVATGLPAGLSLAVASTSDTLVRPGTRTWSIAGTTTAAPGDYPVTVSVTDDAGIVGTTGLLVRVTPEDAEATYTGDALVSGRDGATVLLRATIRDNADTTAGDVRTAAISFQSVGRTLCTATPELVGTAPTVASASCSATLPVGAGEITVALGGNYTGTSAGRVEVLPHRNQLAVVGATLTVSRSAGAYPADSGSAATIALLGNTTSMNTGLAIAGFQSGGRRYQILGNGIDSFGARAGVVDLRGRVSLTDITDPRRPVAVADGLTLRVTGTDRPTDTVGITLWQNNKLLFSSDWSGVATTESRVTKGGILLI